MRKKLHKVFGVEHNGKAHVVTYRSRRDFMMLDHHGKLTHSSELEKKHRKRIGRHKKLTIFEVSCRVLAAVVAGGVVYFVALCL